MVLILYLLTIIGCCEVMFGFNLERKGDSLGNWFILSGGIILGLLLNLTLIKTI